jgi:hypothetical protein
MRNSQPRSGIDWKFAMLWAIATTGGIFIGGFLGVYAGFSVGSAIGQATQGNPEGTIGLIGAVFAGFAVAAAVTGCLQEWVVKQVLVGLRHWSILTLLGATLSAVGVNILAIFSNLPINAGGSGGGLLIGAGVGLAQWLVLKQFSSRAMWWIPVNAMAGGVSLPMLHGLAPLAPVAYAIATAGGIVWILQHLKSPLKSSGG